MLGEASLVLCFTLVGLRRYQPNGLCSIQREAFNALAPSNAKHLTFYIRCFIRTTISSFQALKSPAKICSLASVTNCK